MSEPAIGCKHGHFNCSTCEADDRLARLRAERDTETRRADDAENQIAEMVTAICEAWADEAGEDAPMNAVEHAHTMAALYKERTKLLRRMLEWDHLDGSADGPYWRDEIRAVLGGDHE